MMKVAILMVLLAGLALAMSPADAAIVRNIDLKHYEVKSAAGRASDVKSALQRAQQAAIDNAARALFVQTPRELERYRQVRQTIQERFSEFIQTSELIDKYEESGEIVIELRATVRREPLRQALERAGVLLSFDKILPPSQQPRVLAYLDNATGDYLDEFAISRINDHLARQQIEVIDRATIERLLQEDTAIANAAGKQQVAQLAAHTQANVYLLVHVKVEETRRLGEHRLQQAILRIEAWEPLSSKPLRSYSYRSRELAFATVADLEKSKRAAIEEAVGGASESLTRDIFQVWKERVEQGSRYRLIFQEVVPQTVECLVRELQALGHMEGQETVADTHMFTVRYHGALEDLVEQMVRRLAGKLELDIRQETPVEVVFGVNQD
ncbi:MAG: hypothetical protein HY692_05285 [Cyanobacteria bacterium NC_groundwater_1444_Ag_S-0.65um_54_12]|nr:hypothetical protein [Cyanobacteria bacterium NC_groundwater_1444_Ag_S-0.65um_54_12]